MSTPDAARIRELLDRLLQDPAADQEFWARQFDLGLAWVHFPAGHGGIGADPSLQGVVDEAVAAAGRPHPVVRNQIGVGLVAGTLARHGTERQLREELRDCFSARRIWCQLFSEPGAGSDLANLSTAARREAGGWVVTGQKVWTSFARSADRGLLLARTDPAVPKHRGITCFIVDMCGPGVSVSPIKQINGYARVNEVHLDGVLIDDSARVGPVGAGWEVALTALANERAMLGAKSRTDPGAEQHIQRAVALWQDRGGATEHLDRLMGLWVRAELVRLTTLRVGTGGATAAIGKLVAAELEQDVFELVMDLLDGDALLYPGYDGLVDADYARLEYVDDRSAYLSSRRTTIAGGTSEIMRNVLADRVLGLPPEPRVDKDVPWNQTRRG